MTTKNKQTVTEYMKAFEAGDQAGVLACLTDDVVWDIPGHTHLQGKEAFSKEIKNDAFEGKPLITTHRMTEEDHVVIAEGEVRTKIKNSSSIDLVFCDVFELEGGKIKKLTSYLVNRNIKFVS